MQKLFGFFRFSLPNFINDIVQMLKVMTERFINSYLGNVFNNKNFIVAAF